MVDQTAFTCDTCGKKTANKSALNDHTHRVHPADNVFVCQECGQKFKRKDNMTRHQENKHGESKAAGKNESSSTAIPTFCATFVV